MNDAQAVCNAWNESHPIGTPVTHQFADGRSNETVTQSDAYRLNGVPYIHLEGSKHPVGLKAVRPRVIEPPPDLVEIEERIRGALPRIGDAYDLLVKVTLVNGDQASGVTIAV